MSYTQIENSCHVHTHTYLFNYIAAFCGSIIAHDDIAIRLIM